MCQPVSMWDTNSTMIGVTAPFVMMSLFGTVLAVPSDVPVAAWSLGLHVSLSGLIRALKCNVQEE